jgi:lantibiotic modifying enzyme
VTAAAIPGVTPEFALDVATGIGFGIARRAIWHGDRCTWFDAVPTQPGVTPPTSSTSGGDVYGGTAGIGLFLAQLVARADDVTLRRTARAAIRQALAGASSAAPLGFYGGAAGTATAAILAARELGDDEPVAAARKLLTEVPLEPSDPDANDLLGGTAGSLLALLIAAVVLDDARLLARAHDAAEILLRLALRGDEGRVSWSTMRDRLGDLTGFAHGSAGNAYALLALHAIAPDARLRDAVAGAIAYEATTFSPEQGNWPDLRWFGNGPRVAGYTVAWCHGAVGIVRARLYAEAHGFDAGGDVDAALRTVAIHAERLLADPSSDMTLCHGLFGAVDALLDGVRAGRVEYAPAVARFAGEAAERHHRGEAPWPSGLLTREPIDSLMLGTAGIGHVYLRLADPLLAPILAPSPARP